MKTNAEKLVEYVSKKMREENIPCILIAGDREKARTGCVMDNRNEMLDLNIAMLTEAMTSDTDNAPQLMNAILSAACMIISQHESLEKRAKELIAEMKAAQHEEIVIGRRGEA